MSYVAPKVGEMLICRQAGVGVYAGPSTTTSRLQTNYKFHRELRDWAVNDQIGRIIDLEPSGSPEGSLFLKIQYWTWEKTSAFPLLYGGTIVQRFHTGYIKVEDEPEYWVREEWLSIDLERTEQEDMEQIITAYISTLKGLPQPEKIEKRTDNDGKTTWYLTFPNGTTVDFDMFKNFSPETKIKTATIQQLNLAIAEGGQTDIGKQNTESTTVFTTQNVIISLLALSLLALLLFVGLRSQRQ